MTTTPEGNEPAKPTDPEAPVADDSAAGADTPSPAGDASGDGSGSGGTDGTDGTGTPPPPGRRKKPKGFIRRHKILIAIGVLLVLIGGSASGYLYWINHQLSAVPRVPIEGLGDDPEKNHGGEKDQPLNILLLGADNGQDQETVAEDLEDGKWTPFIHRSDTLMIAHIPADRDSVQLVSIPRDTWVPIEDYPYSDGHAKLNAAFAFGGPSAAVSTVENLTGIDIDHVAMIDWVGFKDLTTALNGVRVYIPETFYDSSQKITWEQGWHTFEGQEALAYVRTRYGLENGDFDRIARQQNFMRATMGKLLASTKNIVTITKVINTVTKFLTIDETWDNDEIRNLAISLRNIKSSDVQFLTAPFGKYETIDEQSVVRLAPKQAQRLFDDIKTDNLQDYLDKYPDALLDGDKSIS